MLVLAVRMELAVFTSDRRRSDAIHVLLPSFILTAQSSCTIT